MGIFAPASKDEVGHFHLESANLQMQNHFVPKIKHQ